MLYLSCKKISVFVFSIYADTILLGNGNDINTLILAIYQILDC